MRQGRPRGRAAVLTGPFLLAALAGCQPSGPLPEGLRSAPERAVARQGDSWAVIGKRLLNVGQYDLALEAFEKSLLIEGVDAEAMTGAGIAAEGQGLLGMAERYFQRARDLAPNSIVAQNNLGVVLYRLGEYYPARQAFQAAFALSDGRNDLAIRNLRLVEAEITALEAARNYVDPAINYDVRRIGSSEFELIGAGTVTPVLEGEDDGPVPDTAPATAPAGAAPAET